MRLWRKIKSKKYLRTFLQIIFIAGIIPVTAFGQGTILVVNQGTLDANTIARLDSILSANNLIADYRAYIPEDLRSGVNPIVLMADYDGANCEYYRDYVYNGGCLIMTGSVPLDFILNCQESTNLENWLGFRSYLNGSGDLIARIDLPQIGVEIDSLLDRTACYISFGGLSDKIENSVVIAEWVCPADQESTYAITKNIYGLGTVYYFSRPFEAQRVRDLLGWVLTSQKTYTWGMRTIPETSI